MAVLAIFTGQGFTKGMYDSLRKELNLERQPPTGAIFHAAAFDESGTIHVADVWTTAEALNEFVNSRLLPAMKKLNVPAPKVEVYPIHKALAYQSIEQYKVK